jgi:hypothetical protein
MQIKVPDGFVTGCQVHQDEEVSMRAGIVLIAAGTYASFATSSSALAQSKAESCAA